MIFIFSGDTIDSATVVYGPWIKAGMDNEYICELYCMDNWDYTWREKFIDEFERPGWIYDGKNYRKRRRQLFLIWDGEDSFWFENRYGAVVSTKM